MPDRAGVLRPPILEIVEGRPLLSAADGSLVLLRRLDFQSSREFGSNLLVGSPAAASRQYQHFFATLLWPHMSFGDRKSWEVAAELLMEGGRLISVVPSRRIGVRAPQSWLRATSDPGLPAAFAAWVRSTPALRASDAA